jgi:agmatine deiminase
MKKLLSLCYFILQAASLLAQDLPKGFAEGEKEMMKSYLENLRSNQKSTLNAAPPPYQGLRNAAEWEEVQTLVITWTSYTAIHREIIKAVQAETKVLIICTDSNTVKNNLTSNNVPHTNLRFLHAPFNSVWIRDYFGNTVYSKGTDSLLMVDWIYNRPRPYDNVIPAAVANMLSIPLYETTTSPFNLIHTGGNYMSDGFGTAFSSALTDSENSTHSSAYIDTIMKKFMGIHRYVRFPVLPYDGIHHIDMHMKLLDEETLLIGEYPTGVADGPQIEANLQYILNNYNSVYGTPYKVVRIPMPKDKNNKWPSQSGGWYCTYTNGIFVNKTYIFPTYYQQYDTTAFRILKQNLPGYNVVGIDVDNGTSPLISAGGAIHCITHAVGVEKPLLISHQKLNNQCDTGTYKISAKIMHKSGIANAQVFWTTDTLNGFTATNMTATGNDNFVASIPTQTTGTKIYYYIVANSQNGKTISRPMTAPLGRWHFEVLQCLSSGTNELSLLETKPIYPNPASAITCIPLRSNGYQELTVVLRDLTGRIIETIYKGNIMGEKNVFLLADRYAKGIYLVEIKGENNSIIQKLIIK